MDKVNNSNKLERFADAVGNILRNRTEADIRKVVEAIEHYMEAPEDAPDAEAIALLGNAALKALVEQDRDIDDTYDKIQEWRTNGLPAEAHRRYFTFIKDWEVLIDAIEDDADKLAMYEAIMGYGLDLIEPSLSPKYAKVFDEMIRPSLDWDWYWHLAIYGDAATEVEAEAEATENATANKCVATGKKWIKTDEERKWDVQYEFDRPFSEVLRERIDKLPDDERTKLYEAIDRGNPSDEVLTLSMRIVLGIFKDAYEHSPEAFAEAMGWDKTDKTE